MRIEGIVSKRKDGVYRSGRNDQWTKVTCRHRETFAIVGVAYEGSKFDGVYLGRADKKKLVYAGKVENGFSDQQVRRLSELAGRLKVARAPVALGRNFPKAHWLQPRLLADVEFRGKTPGGLPRNPPKKATREDLME
jgi:bifunctional non-homologous end joining protein LigD